MKVSSRFRYGLRLLVDLAANFEKGPVLLRDIADCEKISKKYLEQIVITLRTAGILGATRGSKGGYYLTRSPDKIKLVDIYRLLEGPFAPVECIDNPKSCVLKRRCPTRQLWSDLSKSIENTFSDITLTDLLERKKKLS